MPAGIADLCLQRVVDTVPGKNPAAVNPDPFITFFAVRHRFLPQLMNIQLILQKTRMRPVYTTLVLMLVLAALLFTAGCESEEPATPAATTVPVTMKTIPTRHVTTTLPTTIITTEPVPEETTPEPVATPVKTAVVSFNSHPEYIRLDETTYAVGEVVRFYLVNKGPEIRGCDYAHPSWTIYHISAEGARFNVSTSDPGRTTTNTIIEGEIATATGPFSLDTGRLGPGRYVIQFTCGGNISREFTLKPRVPSVVGLS